MNEYEQLRVDVESLYELVAEIANRLAELEASARTVTPRGRENARVRTLILAFFDTHPTMVFNAQGVADNLGLPGPEVNNRLMALALSGLIKADKQKGRNTRYRAAPSPVEQA